MDLVALKKQLRIDEGVESKPYRDSEGILTIGVGWNLEERGLPESAIDDLLNRSAIEARDGAVKFCATDEPANFVPGFYALTPARQQVLANMAFNLGAAGLRTFKNMRKAVHAGDWEEAADQMLDSKWATQVGERAQRLAREMREG